MAQSAEARDETPIEGFQLRTIFGDEFSLADVEARCVVVAFIGVECPLAKLYTPRLMSLAEQYPPGDVAFLAVSSNRQDAVTRLQRYFREYEFTFPLLKDPGNRVADQFGAERTPEVFVLDERRVVRYRGRIDDQYGIGYQRPAPERQDLAVALQEILADREVSRPRTEAPGCLIGRVREPNPESPVTWSEHIAPLFQQHCQSCHRAGQIAPFPLVDYDHVAGWAEMIGEVVAQGRMPPWHASPEYGHFANDARLPEEDRQAILTWVQNGAPLGDPDKLPPPREFTPGWQISEPDQIIYISDEPVEIPAEGTIDYRYYTVDPGFEEDVWIREVECRPGNASVVHHMTAWIWMPGESWIESFRHFLGGSALGWGHMSFPQGTARRVPAGARIVFVLHYTAVGTPQTDRSFMGLVRADPDEVERSLWTVAADRTDFVIPPYESDVQIEAWYEFEQPARLVAMFPHMHLRGKSFRYIAHWPDGESEILLDVPQYDFNWQENYILAEQRLLPAGTRVQCIATYDNSADNPANPDPSASVVWGHQSWDEMMDGFLIVASDRAALEVGDTFQPSFARSRWLLLVGLSGLALVVLIPTVRAVRGRQSTASAVKRPAPEEALWRWFVALGVLALLPGAVLIQTSWALAAGWVPDSQVLVKAATGAAWFALALVGLVSLLPAGRKGLARRAPQMALAVGSLLATWLVVEGVWAAFGGPVDPHLQPAHARYRLEPDAETYFGVSGEAVSSFNAQGVRGPELPGDDAMQRVLIVGGSTSEGLFLGDDETWPGQLAHAMQRLADSPPWVGSAAATGLSLPDHVRLVAEHPLVDEVDCVVVLAGVHDLMAELLHDPTRTASPPLWYRSELLARVRDVWARRVSLGPLGDATGRVYESGRRFQEIAPREDIDWDAALREYAAHIEALQNAARARGVRLVLVTQPVLWSDDLSWAAKKRLVLARVVPAGREWPLLTPENLRPLVDRFNDVLRDHCREEKTELVDAAATMSGQEAWFYDDYHVNEAGAAQLGHLVAEHFASPAEDAPAVEDRGAD